MSSESFKLSGVQRLLEASLVVSCLFALYLMTCLFTFDQADPGWSQAGYQSEIRNLGGSVGAYLSDLLLNLFGGIAYTLPLVIALLALLLFQRFHRLIELDYLTLGLKIIGFILLFIGFSALASMNFNDLYYFSAGGIVGDAISQSFLPYLSFVGSTLLFLTFVLSGFVLLTGISWLLVIDTLGEYTIKAIMACVALPSLIREKFGTNERTQANKNSQTSTDEKETVNTNNNTVPTLESDKNSLQYKGADAAGDNAGAYDFSNDLDINDDNTNVSENFDRTHSLKDKEQDDEFIMPEFSASEDIDDIFIRDNDNSRADPFIDIDELMDGPIQVNVQEHVSDDEITAAFEHVDPIDMPLTAPVEEPVLEKKIDGSRLPSIDLLDRPDKKENPITPEEQQQVGHLVEAKLLEYGVKAEVVGVFPGPVITRFELDLAPGIKASKITGLSTDLARSLSAKSVRVVEVIEGKSYIGIELPNKFRETVFFSSVLANDKFNHSKSSLTMAIGSDISGEPVITDLAKMPHLLVAGTTGSGKSVAINTMIVSILYKSAPEDVRMIMIDPKQVELSVYDGIPHLLSPVVTDMKEAANALRWCVGEMERRYQLMSKLGVRNLKGFNDKVQQAIDAGEPLIDPLWQPTDAFTQTPPTLERLPSIVIIVDEFADMMMIVGKKVEELIARIAQKARAAGIHLILATQRPSADVITGLIKANIPTRMALRVQSRIESRIILDQQGAEQLLGMGDMFYLAPGEAVPIRVHGAFVDDHEVHAVVNDWKERGEPNYLEEVLTGEGEGDILLPGEQAEDAANNELDALYDEALAFITETRRVSISSIQRKFRIGYNRSARIVEDMENQGVVSRPGHNGAREVLAPPPVKG